MTVYGKTYENVVFDKTQVIHHISFFLRGQLFWEIKLYSSKSGKISNKSIVYEYYL